MRIGTNVTRGLELFWKHEEEQLLPQSVYRPSIIRERTRLTDAHLFGWTVVRIAHLSPWRNTE